MVHHRQASDFDVTIPSQQLFRNNNDRQLFQNKQGALLELASVWLQGETSLCLVEGAPLPSHLLGGDDQDDDDRDDTMDAAIVANACCFRATVSNDARLHFHHFARAIALTLVFAATLLSCDCLLRSLESAQNNHWNRRTTQLSSLVNSVQELLDTESSNTTTPSPSTSIITSYPTVMPTLAETTASPTKSPTGEPTLTPVAFGVNDDLVDTDGDLFVLLERRGLIDNLHDTSSPQYKAYRWMMIRDGYDIADSDQLLQRYAMVVLDFAFHPTSSIATFSQTRVHECHWNGVDCNDNNAVSIIKWPQRGLEGSLPSELRLLRSSLTTLDLGENAIQGTIHDDLYSLAELKSLYIHQNKLTGSLSENVENLYSLVNFYAHNNSLTGTIPASLGSVREESRPLRYLTLSNNRLVGSIPHGLRLKSLFYLDLGHNFLEGSIPDDWLDVDGGTSLDSLRHLYLDHSNFTGSLPESFATLGEGRMHQLYLSDNRFTGVVPGGYEERTFLQQVELQNNDFDAVDQDICNLAVWVAGEMASLKADCSACDCEYFCLGGADSRSCYNSSETKSSLR